MKISNMGIKRKVMYGCIILAVVLFFSGVISIFEFSRMNNYVSELVADNVKSINTARNLLALTEKYNLTLMFGIGEPDEEQGVLHAIGDDSFTMSFNNISETFISPLERNAADSVRYAYTAYMQIVNEAEDIWQQEYMVRREWFFERLQPVYMKLSDYIQQLTFISQDALIQNSQTLEDSFYRSLMPAVISVIMGILLLMLFNYFLNAYMINPILKITKGIRQYTQFGRSYDVKVENDDEIAELNKSVKDIIDLNISLKRKIKEN